MPKTRPREFREPGRSCGAEGMVRNFPATDILPESPKGRLPCSFGSKRHPPRRLLHPVLIALVIALRRNDRSVPHGLTDGVNVRPGL